MLTKVTISNVNSIRNATLDFRKNRYTYKNDMIYMDTIVSPIALLIEKYK